jgi:hypothetical protein
MTAEYRSVQTRMWREDEWFQSLDTDARLLFIYLFTNPSASIAGIYRLPLRTIEFESGLDKARITELLAQFSAANKAHYADGVLWVVKMRENQLPGTISPKVKVRLDKDIASIPDCSLKIRYLKHYGYPIDTVSILDRTDTDTDTDTDHIPAGAGTTPRKRRKPERTTEQQEYFGAVCFCVGWDYKTITETQSGQVAQTVGVLQKASYSLDDLRAFYRYWHNEDWRGKQGQYPTLSQLRAEIGKVKALPGFVDAGTNGNGGGYAMPIFSGSER